jgi:hypothetical protein
MTQKRGQLTERIKKRSAELLGYEMNVKELRLMPYIVYTMMNEQQIEPNKIDSEERKILRKWKDAGYIDGGASGLQITEEFWNILCEFVWLGYVDLQD